jgi:hypothetical protein
MTEGRVRGVRIDAPPVGEPIVMSDARQTLPLNHRVRLRHDGHENNTSTARVASARFLSDPIGSLFNVNSEIGVVVVATRAP